MTLSLASDFRINSDKACCMLRRSELVKGAAGAALKLVLA